MSRIKNKINFNLFFEWFLICPYNLWQWSRIDLEKVLKSEINYVVVDSEKNTFNYICNYKIYVVIYKWFTKKNELFKLITIYVEATLWSCSNYKWDFHWKKKSRVMCLRFIKLYKLLTKLLTAWSHLISDRLHSHALLDISNFLYSNTRIFLSHLVREILVVPKIKFQEKIYLV